MPAGTSQWIIIIKSNTDSDSDQDAVKQVRRPVLKHTILIDEAGRNLKADVFFSLIVRKYYSFLDYSRDICNGLVDLDSDVVIACVGIGYIFKFTRKEVEQSLEQFMQSVLFMRPRAKISSAPCGQYFSDLLRWQKHCRCSISRW